MLGGPGDVDIVSDTVGVPRTAPGGDTIQIPPVPLLNGKNQKRIRIPSSRCAMKSETGSGEAEITHSTWTWGDMTPSQLAAALSSRDTTSPAIGRVLVCPSQQR